MLPRCFLQAHIVFGMLSCDVVAMSIQRLELLLFSRFYSHIRCLGQGRGCLSTDLYKTEPITLRLAVATSHVQVTEDVLRGTPSVVCDKTKHTALTIDVYTFLWGEKAFATRACGILVHSLKRFGSIIEVA
jgi:hypothetical protein